ncbi:MAG: 50S ribosomal protein L25 [Dehalococcoidaceae bacterium]|nr:50S ribosomal protein L25 [Dehalococcoidaceae bacterium]
MEKATVKTQKRQLTGKKVRFLRREGIIPANVYGHGIKSLSLKCQEKELETIIKGGTSRIVMLDVEGDKKKRSVLIKNVSYHPITRKIIHVDFYQVRMSQKMTAEIPLVLTGHAPALDYKENFLDHQLNEIAIECLPDKLPAHIEVDISDLKEVGHVINAADVTMPEGVMLVTPGEHIVVRVAQAAKVELEAEEEEVAAEVEKPAEAELEAGAESGEEE